MQVNVDDTGLDGRGPWFILSALLGTAEDWASVSDRWKAILDEPPRIAYFKMDEAVGYTEQFYGWSETNRNYKLTRLARSLQGEHNFIEQTLTTEINVVRRELKARATKPADDPYFWAFHQLINAIGLSLLVAADYDEPFEIFFDENPIFGPRARAWWPIWRAIAEPRLRRILPIDPLFKDDQQWMPLQAADLTAWMSRRDKTGTNEFAWLREHLGGVRKSPHCVEFGAREIGLMFDKSPMPPEQQWRIRAAREALEQTFIKGRARHFVPKRKKTKKTKEKR